MKKILPVWAMISTLALFVIGPARAELGIGGGVYYNRQLGDIKDDDGFEKDFISYMLSVKYEPISLLAVEGSLDYYPGKDAIDYTVRPMATGLLQLSFLNAGVGINSTYTKYESPSGGTDDKWSDLSYHFKAGIQLDFFDLLWICGDCYYFVDELKDVEDFDSDLLTFGARAFIVF